MPKASKTTEPVTEPAAPAAPPHDELTAHRGFYNATALTLLLAGLGAIALAIGGLVRFGADIAAERYTNDTTYEWGYRILALGISFLILLMGVLLVAARPRIRRDTAPQPIRSRALWGALRFFTLAIIVMGALLLYDIEPYGRDSTLAAVLIVGGLLGFIGLAIVRRPEENLAATGAVFTFLAAALILFAQLRLGQPTVPDGTYGPWEATSVLLTPVAGPIAAMIAALSMLVYVYVRMVRSRAGALIGMAVAALVLGLGWIIYGVAQFLETPWSTLADASGETLAMVASLDAGLMLFAAAGVSAVFAAVLSIAVSSSHISRATRARERKAEKARRT